MANSKDSKTDLKSVPPSADESVHEERREAEARSASGGGAGIGEGRADTSHMTEGEARVQARSDFEAEKQAEKREEGQKEAAKRKPSAAEKASAKADVSQENPAQARALGKWDGSGPLGGRIDQFSVSRVGSDVVQGQFARVGVDAEEHAGRYGVFEEVGMVDPESGYPLTVIFTTRDDNHERLVVAYEDLEPANAGGR